MEEQKTKNLQSFNNALPMLIQKDINANILMFMFVAMYTASNDAQKETVATFINKLADDMINFFSKKLTIDFDDLSDLEIKNYKDRIEYLVNQNLKPILTEIERHKNDSK